MRKSILLASALTLITGTTAVVHAQLDSRNIEAEKRLYPKSANPDGTLQCARGCSNPVTLCC
jgi:hypothetical protein